jgi:hypothetical protein
LRDIVKAQNAEGQTEISGLVFNKSVETTLCPGAESKWRDDGLRTKLTTVLAGQLDPDAVEDFISQSRNEAPSPRRFILTFPTFLLTRPSCFAIATLLRVVSYAISRKIFAALAGLFLCLMLDLIAPSIRQLLHHRFTADRCAVPAEGTYSRKDGKSGLWSKVGRHGFLDKVDFDL